MNNDLISREALKKHKVYSEERHEYVVPVYNIDNAPTIEDLSEYSDKLWKQAYERGKTVERPQGKWINQSQGAKYPCECSKCHKEPIYAEGIEEGYVLSDFCPYCGADMREEAENEKRICEDQAICI